MPALSHRRARVLAGRGAWFGAAVALLALVILVLVRQGAGEAGLGESALAPDAEGAMSGSALEATGVALAFEVAAPDAEATTLPLMAEGPRRVPVAARPKPEATIVVGFQAIDEVHGNPLDVWRVPLDFTLSRGAERWIGRQVQFGSQRSFDASHALGRDPLDTLTGPDTFVQIELDPATPRGVPLAFELELTFEPRREGGLELLPRATYAGTGTLTLSGAPHQRLADVLCRRLDAWASGAIVAGPQFSLEGARVELIEVPALLHGHSVTLGGDVLTESTEPPEPAAASAPVRLDWTFSIPAPSRPTLPRMRLRLVLADGRAFLGQGVHAAFRGGIDLHLAASRTASGRLLLNGQSATGLAHLHAEQDGARVGQVIVLPDGTFTLDRLPYGDLELVIESGRPGGELARLPLASVVANASSTTLDLGVIDVGRLAEVMELELVDEDGAPAAALLRWRGRGGSGGVALRAAALHTLLLAPIVPFEMELVAATRAEPIPLAANPGRVRIVVGE